MRILDDSSPGRWNAENRSDFHTNNAYERAAQGTWELVLTPLKPVPKRWFGDLKGKKVLGLASGGGQQMPILTAAGAVCTVLDYSEKQLESERLVARREGYDISVIRADMTEPLPFADETFDLIVHPVSNCYVQAVKPIFRECFRVLKRGGALLGGYDNGVNFLVDEQEKEIVFSLPFDPLSNPAQRAYLEKNGDGMQFSHTLEEQLGGQLEAGFQITDLFEDRNSAGRLHEMNIPSFFAVRAIKP